MKSINQIKSDNDDRVFEQIKTTHLIYPSTLISIIIFVITFYFYYKSDLILLSFLPFYSSYVISYIILLILIYIISIFLFRNKAINMRIFAPHVKVYGYHPLEFSSRLGVKYIDIVGAILSFIFCILSIVLTPLEMLFPGFLLFLISFISSIKWSNRKKWEFVRRE